MSKLKAMASRSASGTVSYSAKSAWNISRRFHSHRRSVTKDPIGTKGARLTTHLSVPSRYLVYMPRTPHVGISLKIEDEAERERLKQVVADCQAP